MNIADLFFGLRADDKQLQLDVSKAGNKAGQTFGQKFQANIGRVISTSVGTVLGAGFAIAAKGAAELDAATRQFQADTGATAEEATKASHAIAGMYRDNLQGFEQISAALSKVHTDLGLAGEEAEKVTEQFLKFGTATGQDAAEAVSSVDDILDAWNLTAADSAEIMDLLIASHQEYGGSIADNEKALGDLAPAMQALGADVDDTVGLLNLFASSGIDASKATAALNKAVAGLKPGQTLDDLIEQISSIEDPTLRAQEAVKVFGARGGVALANALRPGIDSLQDFVPAAEKIEGATERAADAIESSFGNQFKLLLKNAGGALAEFGNNFGPLLMVAAQIGPKTLGALSAGIGGLAGKAFPDLVAKLGLSRGQTPATPMYVADVTGGGLPGAVGSGGKLGLIGGMAALSAGVAVSALAIMGLGELSNALSTPEQKAAFQANLREQNLRKRRPGSMAPLASTGSEMFGPPRPAQMGGSSPDERENEWTSGWSRGVDKLHDDLIKAIQTIRESNDPAAIGAAVSTAIASVIGGRGSAETTRGLIDNLKTQLVAAEAANNVPLATQIKAAIAQLEPFAKGRQWQSEQLAKAQKVVDSNKTTADKVAALKTIQSGLLSHQRTMAAGIIGQQIKTVQRLDSLPNRLKNALGGILFSGSAPGKEKDDTFTSPKPPKKSPAFGGKPPDERALGGPVFAGDPYWVGEQGKRELFVPRVSGQIVPISGMDAGSGGSRQGDINVSVQGLIRARDPFELAQQVRRVRDFVTVTPSRQPA